MKRVLVLVCLLLSASSAYAQSAEDLFQQALRVERVSSNPEAAIALYQQIVELPGADRELVARAWLQMGKAYEVLGEEGAVRAYSRVVRDYGEFSEVARDASGRLAGLAESENSRPTRPMPGEQGLIDLPEGRFIYGSGISPGGRWLALVRDTPLLYDTVTGESRELPEVSSRCSDHPFHGEDSINSLRFSSNGRILAWVCWSGTAGFLDLDTGGIEQLISRDEYYGAGEETTVEFLDWTADDRGLILKEYEQFKIMRVVGPGEAPEVVGAFSESEIHWDNNACVLGEGRYLFGNWMTEDERGRPSLYVGRVDLASGEFTRALNDSVRDQSIMGCDKDRDLLFYVEGTDRYSTLMGAHVSSTGEIAEARYLADLPLATWAQPIGLDGNIYYPKRSSHEANHSRSGSLEAGAAFSVGTDRTQGLTLGWSGDGRLRASYAGGRKLQMEDMETGRTWELEPPSDEHRRFDWGPDGTWFMWTSRYRRPQVTWRISTFDGGIIDSLEGVGAEAVLGDGSFVVTGPGEAGTRCWYRLDPQTRSRLPIKCVDDWLEGRGFVYTSPSKELLWVYYRGKESVRLESTNLAGADSFEGRREGVRGPLVSRVFSLNGEIDREIELVDDPLRIKWVDFLPGDEVVLLASPDGVSRLDLRTGDESPVTISGDKNLQFDRIAVHPAGERVDVWPVDPSRPGPTATLNHSRLAVIYDVVGLYEKALRDGG